ncbi:MAG: hypothetical protein HKM93_01350 [Desulfobacteraceae bacterium]|nr:hypothetical protein [Desulfobacteraceae bacterium]
MNAYVDIDETGWQFIHKLYDETGGSLEGQASMYNVGDTLGLDRSAASAVAEKLIGWGLIEIKTLSGGIGITEEGKSQVDRKFGSGVSGGTSAQRLTDAIVLEEGLHPVISQLTSDLKSGIGDLKLGVDSSTELTADIKTTEVQMTSSRPKTAIIRETLKSIKSVLVGSAAKNIIESIDRLLGE